MEPPTKRAKVDKAPYDDDDDEAQDDELSLSADQFAARQDPMYKLDKSRAKSAFKLKSRFEDIFAKYERDFEGVGDEIDLRTGEVLVDNGHLQSLKDVNDKYEDSGEEEEEEEQVSQNPASKSKPLVQNGSSIQNGWQPPPFGLTSDDSVPVQPSDPNRPSLDIGPVDPAWQVPELQISRKFATVKDITLKSLAAPRSHGDEAQDWNDEDYDEIAQEDDEIAQGGDEIAQATTVDDGEIDDRPRLQIHIRTIKSHEEIATQTNSTISTIEQPLEEQPSTNRRGRPKKHAEKIPDSNLPTTTKKLGRPRKNIEHVLDEPVDTELNSGPSLPTTIKKLGRPRKTIEHILDEPIDNELKSGTSKEQAEISAMGQKPQTDGTLDSQGRRSARPRKQPDYYGQIAWSKTKHQHQQSDNQDAALSRDANMDDTLSTGQDNQEHPTLEMADITVADLKSPNPIGAVISPHGDAGLDVATTLNSENQTIVDEEIRSSNRPIALSGRTIRDSQGPSSSLSKRTVADSEAPSSSVSRAPASQALDTAEDVSMSAPKQPAEIFTRNQLDPSYAFSDEEDLADTQFSTEVASASALVDFPDPERVARADKIGVIDHDNEPSVVDANAVQNPVADLGDVSNADSAISNGRDGLEKDILLPEPGLEISIPENEGQGRRDEASVSHADFSETQQPAEVVESISPNSPFQEENVNTDSELPLFSSEDPVGDKSQAGTSHEPPLVEAEAAQDIPASQPTEVQPRSPPRPRASISTSQSHPQTPKKSKSTKSSGGRQLTASAKRSTLASLVPDNSDDEDELSITSSKYTSTPSSFRVSLSRAASHLVHSTPRRTHRNSLVIAPSSSASARSISRRAHLNNTDTKAIRRRNNSISGLAAATYSSPLARSTLLPLTPRRQQHHGLRLGSPTDSLVRTPGGTMRRCGEEGFVCDRDFCFTCCK